MLIYPILTILGFVGIYHQAREILTTPFPNALSLSGLAAQAVVFTLVSVTLILALPFPYEKSDGEFSWRIFSIWYGVIGWDGLLSTTLSLHLARRCFLPWVYIGHLRAKTVH